MDRIPGLDQTPLPPHGAPIAQSEGAGRHAGPGGGEPGGGAPKGGHNVDGVLPDDQRRGGSFTWPPFCENYVWTALQGASLQTELLSRAGYPARAKGSQALRRTLPWLYTEAACPAVGDDLSTVWIVNRGTGS